MQVNLCNVQRMYNVVYDDRGGASGGLGGYSHHGNMFAPFVRRKTIFSTISAFSSLKIRILAPSSEELTLRWEILAPPLYDDKDDILMDILEAIPLNFNILWQSQDIENVLLSVKLVREGRYL